MNRFRLIVLSLVGAVLSLCMAFSYFVFSGGSLWLVGGILVLLSVSVAILLVFTEATVRKLNQTISKMQRPGQAHYKYPSESYFSNILEAYVKPAPNLNVAVDFLLDLFHKAGIGLVLYYKNGKVRTVNEKLKQTLHIDDIQDLADFEESCSDIYTAVLQLGINGKKTVSADIGGQVKSFTVSVGQVVFDQGLLIASVYENHSHMAQSDQLAWERLIRSFTGAQVESSIPLGSVSRALLNILPDSIASEQSKDLALQGLKTSLKVIEKSSNRLARFIDQYRQIQEVPDPVCKDVRIKQLFGNLSGLFSAACQEKAIALRFIIHTQKLHCSADENLLQQAISNLLKNAMESLEGKTGGEIELSAGIYNGSRIRITVKDNGKGMSDEERKKAFVPFYSTKNAVGTGLSIAQQIVKKHGGKLQVFSEEGYYTKAVIVL